MGVAVGRDRTASRTHGAIGGGSGIYLPSGEGVGRGLHLHMRDVHMEADVICIWFFDILSTDVMRGGSDAGPLSAENYSFRDTDCTATKEFARAYPH
jgi:hypothetical protein